MVDFSDQQAVINALQEAETGPIILDFDHTLFLGNSTERFLDSLRPRLLAFLLTLFSDWLVQVLAVLGVCRYNDQRDFARVLICSVLMPWEHRRWRTNGPREGERLANPLLLDYLPPDCEVILISYGFEHVIAPLLDGMGLDKGTLIASRIYPPMVNLRTLGKIHALEKRLPRNDWSTVVFITDSEEDRDLLHAISRSYLVQWESDTIPAFYGLYIPLRYTVQGKYPNSRYFSYQILFEDYAVLLLAYAFSWHYALALGCLFLSLYCIYEIGYYDNDHRAIAYERNPVVSDEAQAFAPLPRIQPWIYALALAIPGILLVAPAEGMLHIHSIHGLIRWVGVLLLVFAAFMVFNRLEPSRRIVVFPVLHGLKTFSFILFVPLTVLGAMLLAAQVVSISANYVLYRWGGDTERFNRHAWRLGIFVLLLGVYGATFAGNADPLGYTRLSLMIMWCIMRTYERMKRKSVLRMMADTVKRRPA